MPSPGAVELGWGKAGDQPPEAPDRVADALLELFDEAHLLGVVETCPEQADPEQNRRHALDRVVVNVPARRLRSSSLRMDDVGEQTPPCAWRLTAPSSRSRTSIDLTGVTFDQLLQVAGLRIPSPAGPLTKSLELARVPLEDRAELTQLVLRFVKAPRGHVERGKRLDEDRRHAPDELIALDRPCGGSC